MKEVANFVIYTNYRKMRARARARVCVCVCVCARARMWVYVRAVICLSVCNCQYDGRGDAICICCNNQCFIDFKCFNNV